MEKDLCFSFEGIPNSRIGVDNLHFPLGCMYSPVKPLEGREPLAYQPLECNTCRSFINPYCSVDYVVKRWICPFCNQSNIFPSSYQQMTENCVAEELLQSRTTVEYVESREDVYNPAYIFVVDTCLSEKEMGNLKNLLLQIIAVLPRNSYIGFITFGNLVMVHELKFHEVPRCYAFNGKSRYNVMQIKDSLSLRPEINSNSNPFIIKIDEADQMLNYIIDSLDTDPFPVPKGERAQRCTGAAISIAISFLQSVFPRFGGNIFVFSSGPITKGPGSIVGLKKLEPLRQQSDLQKGSTTYLKDSIEFFNSLADEANTYNCIVHYFSASFEESGFYELGSMISKTGGLALLAESWGEDHIKDTLLRLFDNNVYSGFGSEATLSIRNSNGLSVRGIIGGGIPEDKNSNSISNRVIGSGGTDKWKLCGVNGNKTLSIYFDVENVLSSNRCFIQFYTRYRHLLTGKIRYRITTTFLPVVETGRIKEIPFDQFCAVSLLTRLMIWKKEQGERNIIEFLDTTMISFSKTFLNGTSISPESSLITRLVYNLRRSGIINTFNFSPDQTRYLSFCLCNESIDNMMLIIMPVLLRYFNNGSSEPTQLELNSLSSDVILLMDNFFRVIIWYGATIASWRDANYQEQPEYSNLKNLLLAPEHDAIEIISSRFPVPQYILCDEDSSLSRYLLTRCNPPSISHESSKKKPAPLDTPDQTFESYLAKLRKMI